MFNCLKAKIRPFLSDKTISEYHRLQAGLAAWRYNYPGRKLKIIGVTGTNGKTTTCVLLGAILELAGSKVAEATTVRFKIGARVWKNNTKMTTISPWILQSFLFKAQRAGCEYVILEVTSHALEQFRTLGIDFLGAVLTNITRDHLDYHKTFAGYVSAKLKLFEAEPFISVINLDDSSSKEFLQLASSHQTSYSIGSKKAQVRAEKIIYNIKTTDFILVTPQGQIIVKLNIKGKFNIYNALASAAVAHNLGISLETIKYGLESVDLVRGRMEEISQGQPFRVIIDYAHTPDAFEKIYKTLRPIIQGRIIAVFGATGNRDTGKRPMRSAIASRFADIIILTNEDPYTENPVKIIKQVAIGVDRKKFNRGKNYFQIIDREKAIKKACRLAQVGDLALITGKGHEEVMAVAHPKNPHLSILAPFNEQDIVKKILGKMGYREN